MIIKDELIKIILLVSILNIQILYFYREFKYFSDFKKYLKQIKE